VTSLEMSGHIILPCIPIGAQLLTLFGASRMRTKSNGVHEPQRSAVLAVRFAMRSVELRAKDRFQSAAVSVLNAYGRKRTFQDGSGRL
jgi:hypothetical protein